MPADVARIKELFQAALSSADAAALLAGEDDETRRRVEDLLAAHARPGLTGPYVGGSAAGGMVGPYKLLQQIGEGGMGVVWMAEQTEPVRRRVAVKVIKPGMASAQVLARFEAERQALAMMDHPNIARVFDAGTTDDGRPYFVMELVHGVPITRYCDEAKLTVPQRLELFRSVCQAIQHAHMKGVIHRDIKPSNVLVCLYDDEPVPKVIDFGVAKALDQPLTERTLFTQFGAVVGTLEYMSPEQAVMNQFGIDTRSDVYSLGVLLYELLTGTTPLERSRLRTEAFDQVLRLIREEEPPRPSTRLSTAEGKPNSESARLAGEVRGELDWIAMKALEKDRSRRYETASALARDVERHLAGEPVEACPPNWRYRMGKVMARHWGKIATAAAFAAVLLSATAVSVWQAIRAESSRQREETERRRAEESEEITREIQLFFSREVFQATAVKAGATGPTDMTIRQALGRAAAKLEGRFPDKPLLEAGIRFSIGQSYKSLGDYALARLQLERACELYRKAAERYPDDRTQFNYHRTRAHLGLILAKTGSVERAIPMLREEMAWFEKEKGEHDPEALAVGNNLAGVLIESSPGIDEGLALLRSVLARRGATDPDVGSIIITKRNLGYTLMYRDRHAEGEKLLREAIASCIETHGEGSIDTARSRFMLAKGLYFSTLLTGNWPGECLPLMEQCAPVYRKVHTDDHPETLHVLEYLARFRSRSNRPREAAEAWLIITGSAAFRADEPSWDEVRRAAAQLLELKDAAKAETLLRQFRGKLPEAADDWWVHEALSLLGEALFSQGNQPEAERLIASGYEGLKRKVKLTGMTNLFVDQREVIRNALGRLIRVAEFNKRPDDIKKWQDEKRRLLPDRPRK